jgi:cysteinyl-tRNA synthetase
MPEALSVVSKVLGSDKAENKEDAELIKKVDEILGLQIDAVTPDKIDQQIKQMDEARNNKEFEKSDELRKNIESQGFVVENSGKVSFAINK